MASKYSNSLEWKRALFHMGILSFILGLSIVIPEHIAKPVAAGIMAFIIGFECLRVYHSGFGRKMQETFSTMFRDEELGKRSAMLDAAIGVSIVFFLFSHEVFVVAVLLTAFPDPAARVIGKKFGRRRMPGTLNKTVAGSAAAFLVAFLPTLPFTSALTALVVALVATIAETYSDRWLKLDDNLTIPVSVALCLTLMG